MEKSLPIWGEEEIVILPCGISGEHVCCIDVCPDKEKIQSYKDNPKSKNNLIEVCYNGLIREQEEKNQV